MKTVICITTRNRPEAFNKCYSEWQKYFPHTPIIVVDDASSEEYAKADYRFAERAGISRVKNKCLELAMAAGAEHIFLADDDVYPLSSDALQPYIDSEHKHLCYTFLAPYKYVQGHKYHTLGNGCMLYLHRDVINKIGGFDTYFQNKYEHTQLSHRAATSGFCPVPFVDVVGSQNLFHAMDEYEEITRSSTTEEMKQQLKAGAAHFNNTLTDKKFYPYCDD